MDLLKALIEKLDNSKVVTNEIEYLSAIEEGKYTIAQANSHINEDGILQKNSFPVENHLNFILSKPDTS